MSDEMPNIPDAVSADDRSQKPTADQVANAFDASGDGNPLPVGGPSDAAIPQELPPAAASDETLSDLPVYARGILKIRVPVRVTLASQRKPIQEIIELGPGSIVKFDKTCDEPLELSVGDRPIATGEVVKVGDKFGLRIGAVVAS